MSYEFRFIFQGLCGFVPEENSKRLQVVLVDARKRSVFKGHAHGTVNDVPAHLPHVIFERAPGDLEYAPPDSDVIYRKGEVRVLSRQELSISASNSGATVTGWQALDLVSEFPRATYKTHDGTIRADCVTLTKGPSELVVARLLASAGEFETVAFPRDWEFGHAGKVAVKGSQGKMAQVVILKVTSDKDEITVAARPMAEPGDDVAEREPDWEVKVRATDETPATVRLRNHPLAAIAPGFGDLTAHGTYTIGDPHFEWFYELLDNPPPAGARPFPRHAPNGAGGPLPGGGNPDCPRARYKPAKF